MCACKGSGKFDPIIEVVPDTGHVYSLFMIGFNVWFMKSTDHGATWSAPVKTYGNVSWNDKPILAVSNDGNDVYASFNGPTGGDPWIAQSHDAGATWTQVKITNSDRYVFAFDGDVDARRERLLQRIEPALQQRRQALRAGRRDRGARLHLARPRCHLG